MTAVCCLYIIAHTEDDGALSGPVKIGIAAWPSLRVYELQAGNPKRLQVAAEFSLPSRVEALSVERSAHQALAANRIRGEWFSSSPEEARKAVLDLLVEIENAA